MDLLETVEFRISVTGDKTGERHIGDFSCLKRLSHRQELARDKINRELLGERPEYASDRAKSQAEMFSDLRVCLVKRPNWWKEAGEGMDLVDDNLIAEVWSKTVEIRIKAVEEVQKKAEVAHEKLKKAVESDPEAKSAEE